MKIIEHYIALTEQFTVLEINKEFLVTRTELAEVLYCSERNVVHILKKMQEKGWIVWKSGRGRGVSSTITFRKDSKELFLETAITWIKKGETSKIFSFIEQLNHNQKQAYYSILPQAFGFHEISNETEKMDVLTFPYFRQLFSLHPAYVERQSERHMVSQCFDTLIEYNLSTNIFTPKLAHYWTFSLDFTEYTFYIRKGIYFHHGKELTTKDIAFTFNQLKESPMKWLIENLTNVIEVDLYTVKFQFLRPQYYWLNLLSSPKFSIIPDQYGGMTPEFFSFKPLGTGPYQIKERTNQQLTLETHPTYFSGRAHLDRIVMVFVPEIEHYVSQQNFHGELVTYFPFLSKQQAPKSFKELTRTDLSIKYLMWNDRSKTGNKNPQFKSLFSSILNKKKLVASLGGNRYVPTDYMSQIVFEETSLDPLDYNLEPITLTALTYNLVPNLEDLDWIQAQLKFNNISLNITILDYQDFIDVKFHKDVDLFYSEFVREENNLASLLNLFYCETSIVFNGLSQAKRKQLAELSRERDGIYKVEHLLLEENILLPLYSTSQVAYFHESIRGTSLSNVGLAPFKDLFFIR
ncbi:MarR-like DNA-binding transcriptional regulator SgrR of sgrS sRNA [Bacillus mesophilus]|uniref:SgrR family transcriptional regulator n=1 Tax=Bacillus mesophilus TaxID=1808955 RepID=A0A6M0Q2W5_9BACI|nr:ABC transporter substrate-binding protein [Bacillus mesophilus]MBM7659676.1 MarR-like DNA-binding transcriptional regulator SgrR of sgrS sRNA [Bacillus mesophilus]NEY70542.1 hypothetical protein [Bacillus mesophilus]